MEIKLHNNSFQLKKKLTLIYSPETDNFLRYDESEQPKKQKKILIPPLKQKKKSNYFYFTATTMSI